MALTLYPLEIGLLQPTLADGKELPVKPSVASYVSSDAAKIRVLGVDSDGYTGRVQAVGVVGDFATITMTVSGDDNQDGTVNTFTATTVVTIVSPLAVTAEVSNVALLAPVKERPNCGPPG